MLKRLLFLNLLFLSLIVSAQDREEVPPFTYAYPFLTHISDPVNASMSGAGLALDHFSAFGVLSNPTQPTLMKDRFALGLGMAMRTMENVNKMNYLAALNIKVTDNIFLSGYANYYKPYSSDIINRNIAIYALSSSFLYKNFSIGASIKYATRKIWIQGNNEKNIISKVLAFDLAMAYKYKNLRVLGSVMNLGHGLRSYVIPLTTSLATSYNLKIYKHNYLKPSLLFSYITGISTKNKPQHPGFNMAMGAEYEFNNIFFLRFGFNKTNEKYSPLFSSYSGGLGLKTQFLSLNLAYSISPKTEEHSRIDNLSCLISWNF